MSSISVTTKNARVFRQNRNKWWLVLFLFAFSLTPLGVLTQPVVPGRSVLGAYIFVACLSAFFLLPAIYVALFTQRGFLQIDESGLRWRGVFRERAAAWSEITDFYEKPVGNSSTLRSVVVTPSGKLTLNDFLDDSADLLWVREAVQGRARFAASTRWESLKDKSEIELPKTFFYKASELWALRLFVAFGSLAPLLMLLPQSGSKAALSGDLAVMVRDFNTIYGWPMVALFVVTVLCFASMYPLMLGAVFLPQIRATKKRMRQRITASERGLTFAGDSVFLEATWNEVREYSRQPLPGKFKVSGLHVVTTTRGTFDFVQTISDFAVLVRLLKQRAPQAQEAKTRDAELSDLGGEAARWTTGASGETERIFRYRTRSNRALLWLLTAPILMLPAVALLFRAFPSLAPPRNNDSILLIAVLLLLAVFPVWLAYFKTQVRIGEDGIAARGLRGETFLSWRHVREYSKDETYGSFRICGANRRIVFWRCIADVEELKSEIARRATGAEKRGWPVQNEVGDLA